MAHLLEFGDKRGLLARKGSPQSRQQPIVQQPIVQQPTQPTDHTEIVKGNIYPVVYSTKVTNSEYAVNIGFFTIPPTATDGETISNIGGNEEISIKVPPGIRGKVIMKVPPREEGGKSRKKKRRSTCKKRTKSRRRR